MNDKDNKYEIISSRYYIDTYSISDYIIQAEIFYHYPNVEADRYCVYRIGDGSTLIDEYLQREFPERRTFIFRV